MERLSSCFAACESAFRGDAEGIERCRKLCEERFGGATRQPEGFGNSLADCYLYCSKYHGDTWRDLYTCMKLCDAMWSPPKIQPLAIPKEAVECFKESINEMDTFAARYREYGKGFEDWQIVSNISYIVAKMLDEARGRCLNAKELIVETIVGVLNGLGIDRYKISQAYTHGVPNEVLEVVKQIFPNIAPIWRPARVHAIEPSPPQPPSEWRAPLSTPRYGRSGRLRSAFATFFAIISFFIWLLIITNLNSQPNTIFSELGLSAIAAIASVALAKGGGRWAAGLWLAVVAITALYYAIELGMVPGVLGAVVSLFQGSPSAESTTLATTASPSPPVSVSTTITITVPTISITTTTITTPNVVIPTITVPNITAPNITITVPTIPNITMPNITVPTITVPNITITTITIPNITVSATASDINGTATAYSKL
ncbi:MAG: hypothetical protein QXP98_05085 [Thermoproteus sp.]